MNDRVLLELRSFDSLQMGDNRPQVLRTRRGASHCFPGPLHTSSMKAKLQSLKRASLDGRRLSILTLGVGHNKEGLQSLIHRHVRVEV